VVSTDLPSDPSDPNRKNDISPLTGKSDGSIIENEKKISLPVDATKVVPKLILPIKEKAI